MVVSKEGSQASTLVGGVMHKGTIPHPTAIAEDDFDIVIMVAHSYAGTFFLLFGAGFLSGSRLGVGSGGGSGNFLLGTTHTLLVGSPISAIWGPPFSGIIGRIGSIIETPRHSVRNFGCSLSTVLSLPSITLQVAVDLRRLFQLVARRYEL